MQRSKLKNIINKSKELSKPTSAFDKFKNSLPEEVPVGYRLQAAWEAYGKPANYKEAVWLGLIQPIDENTIKWPSIGYNTETEEYEYLNEGRENDTIAKDIRVWDNDVIPFVQELKRGGYVRAFNEEKSCWTYSKNPLAETFDPEEEVIEQFQKGGQTKKEKNKQTYYEFLKTLPSNLQNGNTEDLGGRINDLGYRMNLLYYYSPDDIQSFEDGVNKGVFKLENGIYHAPSVVQMPDGNYEFLKPYNHPTINKEIEFYNSPKNEDFRNQYELIKTDNNGNPLKYFRYIKRNLAAFKQGGQMNLIPEGALHARKNNLEGAGEDFTAKGIPVMTTDGKEQVAEIEHSEIILNKELTDFIEENYKKFKSDETSEKEKDELAIKVGKKLVKDILTNTDDRTNLIETVQEQM